MAPGKALLSAPVVGAMVVDPGKALQATVTLHDLLSKLKGTVRICDPYVDFSTLQHLDACSGASAVKLLSDNITDSRPSPCVDRRRRHSSATDRAAASERSSAPRPLHHRRQRNALVGHQPQRIREEAVLCHQARPRPSRHDAGLLHERVAGREAAVALTGGEPTASLDDNEMPVAAFVRARAKRDSSYSFETGRRMLSLSRDRAMIVIDTEEGRPARAATESA